MTSYLCCDERRLDAVRAAGVLNGIEYLEVSDREAPTEDLRQRTLFVRLLLPVPALTPANVTITGGERVPTVAVEWIAPASALPAGEDPALLAGIDDPDRVLVARVASRGDFSQYVLRLVAGAGDETPPAGFDPRLAEVVFSFKVECPSEFDCATDESCPPLPSSAPDIDYLAKDFASFRRLMLDRMSLLAPGWTERNVADLGVTLVEALAYVADELSYRQDAVATEAYLGTARRRTSVRRHARLVDFVVSEGCNARAWVRVDVDGVVPLDAGLAFLTRVPSVPPVVEPGGPEHRAALAAGAETFELVLPAVVRDAHARFDIWTWGDAACCLPAGATSATIVGHHPDLRPGDVVVLAEVVSPTTGHPEDADPARRAAVRLTSVVAASDPSGGLFADPPSSAAVDVTELAWDDVDALPFSLCVSVEDRPGVATAEVWGNVVLVDHGRTVDGEHLGRVPRPVLTYAAPAPDGRCEMHETRPVPSRFRPALSQRPITHAGPVVAEAPASTTLACDPHAARPQIELHGATVAGVTTWRPRLDLLASGPSATEVVVEIEHDRVATVRFGDGIHGRRPEPDTDFTARYRVGNGTAGNVGLGAIAHVVSVDGRIRGAANPLPAAGGVNPEPTDAVRRDAPEAFLVQQRAVTADDYARVAERAAGVQRAAATFRWTGSWHTVFVTADRRGGLAVDAPFEQDVRAGLEPFRMAGYDLEVDGPQMVALDVRLFVCVEPSHFRADVKAAVLDVLSSRVRADGTLGFFHPDRFTFGQPVFLSAIVAAAQAVPGVASVEAHRFQRQRDPASSGLHDGVLRMGRLEIARLDDDPSFPERGTLAVDTGGGK